MNFHPDRKMMDRLSADRYYLFDVYQNNIELRCMPNCSNTQKRKLPPTQDENR